ncbi:hypothetical protein [Microbacterium sp. NPDC055683]
MMRIRFSQPSVSDVVVRILLAGGVVFALYAISRELDAGFLAFLATIAATTISIATSGVLLRAQRGAARFANLARVLSENERTASLVTRGAGSLVAALAIGVLVAVLEAGLSLLLSSVILDATWRASVSLAVITLGLWTVLNLLAGPRRNLAGDAAKAVLADLGFSLAPASSIEQATVAAVGRTAVTVGIRLAILWLVPILVAKTWLLIGIGVIAVLLIVTAGSWSIEAAPAHEGEDR